MPVVAGGARRGAAGISAMLCEGRGETRSVLGVERTATHACDHLPALGAVGKAVGERSMQIQTGEMRRAMDGADGVMPQRPGLMGARLKALDALVRVLTFGRWAHLRNSPSGFLIMGNNCLKQHSFGVCPLFFPVVPVVSNFKPHG